MISKMETGSEEMQVAETHDGSQQLLEVEHPLSDTGDESLERISGLGTMVAAGELASLDASDKFLHYGAGEQELVVKLAANEAENKALRAANKQLTRQLEQVRKLLVVAEAGYSQSRDLDCPDNALFVSACKHADLASERKGTEPPMPLDTETANFLLSALQDSPVYVTYSDLDLRYVWANRTMKGFTFKDIIGKRDDELVPPGTDGLAELIEMKSKALRTRETQIAEVTINIPADCRRSFITTSRPYFNQEGILLGIASASIDITQQVEIRDRLSSLKEEMVVHKATEEKLRQAVHHTEEAICAKNRFLAIMSHEIRTPLNGLIGLADALDSTELTAEQRELVNSMQSSGVIIADILSDILDLASMDAGGSMTLEEQPFNPAEVVENILKMALAATREKGIAVETDVTINVPTKVIGDALRIRQVMKYLVLNAIKFTHGGKVTIRLDVKNPISPSDSLSARQDEKPGFRSSDYLTKRKAMSDDDNRGCSPPSEQGESSSSSSYWRGIENPDATGSSRSSTEQKRTHFTATSSEELVEKFRNVGNSQVPSLNSVLRQDITSSTEQSFIRSESDGPTPMLGVEQLDVRPESGEAATQQHNCKYDEILLWCEIVDTGVGIPKEAFPTLFDKFTQVNSGSTRTYGGTGLGLAICKQLVELMGGQLSVTSEVGKGSIFTFTVLCKMVDQMEGRPDDFVEEASFNRRSVAESSADCEPLSSCLNQASVGSPDGVLSDTAAKSGMRNQPRILLAEDNKVNVMVAISMLKRLGFTAQVVANGVEALEAVRREQYDLVLLDICMPLMDGLQVAYAIRQYEETGRWPEEDLHEILASASQSMLQADSDCEGGELRNQGCRDHNQGKRDLVDALEGLRKSGLEGVKRLPIVAVTANALRSDVDKYFAHGMDAFIAKPVMFQKLRDTLAKYLPIQQPSPPVGACADSSKGTKVREEA